MVSTKKRIALRKKKIKAIVTFNVIIISSSTFTIIAVLKQYI
jgi:hypothetical protein